jgi:hypothetical protein
MSNGKNYVIKTTIGHIDDDGNKKPLSQLVNYLHSEKSSNDVIRMRKYQEKKSIINEVIVDGRIDYDKFTAAIKKRYPFTYQNDLIIQLVDLVHASIIAGRQEFEESLLFFLGQNPETKELNTSNSLDVKIHVDENNPEDILNYTIKFSIETQDSGKKRLLINVYKKNENGANVLLSSLDKNMQGLTDRIVNFHTLEHSSYPNYSCDADKDRIGDMYVNTPLDKFDLLTIENIIDALNPASESERYLAQNADFFTAPSQIKVKGPSFFEILKNFFRH